ncbi:hypothetical protein AAG747_19215 [Rapidithrix thailandica]|uniref:Uncharacterized protein n=1 Tax=Rapidithrix thailandica TaxID=413964 RepID=A0AAW9SGT6_9BACT
MSGNNIIKFFLVRLLIVILPLVVLYFAFEAGVEANNQKEHKTDVGLGFAILLFFIFIILTVGFVIDFIKNLYKKHYDIALIDIPFLLVFLIPIIYIHCQMGGCCEGFCDWYINFLNF